MVEADRLRKVGGYYQIEFAIVVVITGVHAHPALKMALGVALRSAGIASVLPLSRLIPHPQVALHHIVRQVERRLPDAHQVGSERPPGLPRIFPIRNGPEVAAIRIEKEFAGEGLIDLRAAGGSDVSHLADLLGLLVELQVLGDIEIQLPVAIEIGEGCAQAPVQPGKATLLSYILKLTAAQVPIEGEAVIARQEDVRKPIAVIVTDGAAHPVAMGIEAALRGDIFEGA